MAGEMENQAEMLIGMQQSLSQLAEGLQGSPMPEEAQAHLANAAREFEAFIQTSGLMGASSQGGNGAPEAAGRSGVAPEGAPMREGAVPA